MDTPATAKLMTEMALELKSELRSLKLQNEMLRRTVDERDREITELKRKLREAERLLPIAEAK